MDCPKCKLISPPGTERCDCGYDFKTGQVKESYLTQKDKRSAATSGPLSFGGQTLPTLVVWAAMGAMAWIVVEAIEHPSDIGTIVRVGAVVFAVFIAFIALGKATGVLASLLHHRGVNPRSEDAFVLLSVLLAVLAAAYVAWALISPGKSAWRWMAIPAVASVWFVSYSVAAYAAYSRRVPRFK